MKKNFKRPLGSLLSLLLLLLACFTLSLFIGRYRIDPRKLLDPRAMDRRVFLQLRLGRSLTAMAAGLALGVAGSVFQAVFRNPLASPDVAGVASGACAGAAAAILLGGAAAATALSAFFGGMLALALALILTVFSRRRGIVPLLLSGIVVNALFQAILMLLKLSADTDHVLASIEFWLMGSFADCTLGRFRAILGPIAAALTGVFLLRRPIEMLTLEDDEAAMLGLPVARTRTAALILATALTGSVISVAGLITFVGLIAPHISRLLVRGDRACALPAAGLTGGILVLLADILARSIAPAELPVSIITSLIGAPALFALICGRRGAFHE